MIPNIPLGKSLNGLSVTKSKVYFGIHNFPLAILQLLVYIINTKFHAAILIKIMLCLFSALEGFSSHKWHSFSITRVAVTEEKQSTQLHI